MKSNIVMDRIPPLPNDLEALIFDCDGTLVDTMPFHLQAWEQICQETGLDFSKESFIATAGIPGREIIKRKANKQGIFLDVLNVYNRKKALYIQSMRKAPASSLPISCVVNFAIEAKAANDSLLFGVATGSSRLQVEEGTFNISRPI
jgi:beta-phosphoglucomutase-like phosphatase (HAD superfamily)